MTTQRTAIVTGAARGIGASIARRLAHDGYHVAVLDLDEAASKQVAEKIRADGGAAAAIRADVSSEDSVAAAVDRVCTELGEPTILVNNAGVIRDNLLFRMSVDDWNMVLGVHLGGAFLLSRAAQTFMTKARFGRIINLSSTGALGNRGQANYSAAKAGLQGLTKTLAIELGRFGITVNAIAPGFVETDMTRAAATGMGISFEELKAKGAEKIPVGRVGQPADIAAATSFFVSEEAGFISGQVLYVAGGPVA